MDRVKFTAMKDGDKADYDFLTEHEVAYTKGTADRLLEALVDLDKGLSGYQVTRLDHFLQAATRAERDGADIDWVVAALLHDIGDIYPPYNHDEYAAAVIRPFVREHVGANPEKRQAYAGHAYFDDCVRLCERWDQSSFDPANDTLPVSHFADRVREVFAREPYNPNVIQTGARLPLGTG